MNNWTRTPYDPYAHAIRLRIPVVWEEDQPEPGRWHAPWHLIILRSGMPPIQDRCILAHELGHACMGHTTSTPKQERQADRWAATHLITAEHLTHIAAFSPDPGIWCRELQVTPRILDTYLALPEGRQWLSQRNGRVAI
ncbi:ImmA/IrrE family metallo-endopeptidase [Pseudoclavibacter helvolus]|uniref:ImmA/IrrE family metallo-endopeptidase n=1 Tax=Pseudoclavibacter helvolus TaxID=255205 RepID=UPI003C73414E